jgi:hypothetical protein
MMDVYFHSRKRFLSGFCFFSKINEKDVDENLNQC